MLPQRRSLLQCLEFLAGFETNGFAGGNRYFRAGAGVAANAGLAGFDGENAEAAEFDAITMFEGALHLLEYSFDGHFSLGFGDARLVNDFVDDVELNQITLQCSPNRRTQTDDRIRVISMSSKRAPGPDNSGPGSGNPAAERLSRVDSLLYRQTC